MTENKNTDDLLGYADYAHTLWARILAALNSDLENQKRAKEQKSLGDDPLVVGIFGEWGAGKSRLLQLIHRKAEVTAIERFTAHKKDSGMDLTVPVFFQPWKYEHEPHLLVPLLMHILAELNQSLTLSKGLEETVKQQFDSAGDTLVKAMPNLVSSFGNLVKNVAAKFTTADPTGTAAGLAIAGVLASYVAKEKKPIRRNAKDISFEDYGRSYYEIHEILKHITRPKTHKYTHPNHKIDHDIRINFVIFIDDLDRCLPEKAVETLELIKTIFNAESFAFVLALDEEVIERGIGHRYRDYNFEGKKPEMPITGFEYLEKIVHLPFRLPAITVTQALSLLEEYEKKVIAKPNTTLRSNYVKEAWMLRREIKKSIPITVRGKDQELISPHYELNLAHMAVNCFEVYVPRKLIRIVELFHQVLEVLHARGRLELVGVGKVIDPRLMMAFVLLQLFHPDLYRACKRSAKGFEVLLEGFSTPDKTSRENAFALTQITSDVDILHWAVGWWGEKPPATLKSAKWRVANEVTDKSDRYDSLSIKLPLAERILEHRSAERHAFDPMRLFEQLRGLKNQDISIDSRLYMALLTLGKDDVLPIREDLAFFKPFNTGDAATAKSQTLESADEVDTSQKIETEFVTTVLQEEDVSVLYTALVSGSDVQRKRTVEIAKLSSGETIPIEIANALLEYAESELAKVSDKEKALQQQRLMAGLQHLAPHFPKDSEHLSSWWQLIEPLGKDIEFESKVKDLKELQAKLHVLEVKALLGQDNRFDSQNLHFPTQKWSGHSDEQEPIPGFVNVIAKNEVFKPFNDQPEVKLKPFYMARYLTTVSQYAEFVKEDYKKQEFWTKEGLAWKKKQKLNESPDRWAEQQLHGNRPVMRVSWYDVQAYVKWLNQRPQFVDMLNKTNLTNYKAALPTEWQWERAARAADFAAPDERDYPWGGKDSKTAHLHANIDASKIGAPCVVGMFEPNPLGIFDLSGNVWEWQANTYAQGGESMSLRGGSWAYLPDFARCSGRGRYLPDIWDYVVGFRLVLSLADFES